MALDLDVSRTKDIAVVRCRGRIVFGREADELRRVILGLLNEFQRIVLSFAWVEYIDSNGLGTLVASLISARHRGAEIKLAALGLSGHLKTGQRWSGQNRPTRVAGTPVVLPRRILWWQVCFCAPTARATFEHVAVMEQSIEHGGDGCTVAQ
jgi:anti-anti-sigma factor